MLSCVGSHLHLLSALELLFDRSRLKDLNSLLVILLLARVGAPRRKHMEVRFATSGDKIAALPFEDVHRRSVRDVKRKLAAVTGVNRFRQKLLHRDDLTTMRSSFTTFLRT
eukprot:s2022_g17.t1